MFRFHATSLKRDRIGADFPLVAPYLRGIISEGAFCSLCSLSDAPGPFDAVRKGPGWGAERGFGVAAILCVDDETSVVAVLQQQLRELGHQPLSASNVDEAIRALVQHHVDLVILDCVMPGRDGFTFLDHVRERGLQVPTIIMTGYSSIEHAVNAMRRGAVDYLTKPLRAESVRIAVKNALEVDRLRRENEQVRQEIHLLLGPVAIVGESEALRDVLEAIDAVAPTRAPVLFHGEPGSGKKLFAREIHAKSSRRGQPFVSVNVAGIPEDLIEKVVFGQEQDEAAGVPAPMPGAFERAAGGTLLLDEIAALRPDLHGKLLRALHDQEIERVGGTQPIKVDVRIVATTSKELEAEVEAGRFRRDLYFRLNVVSIRTPSLRERPEDIPSLTQFFVVRKALELGVKAPSVPAHTLDYLRRQPWRGNVHELANTIERAMIFRSERILTPEAMEQSIVSAPVIGSDSLVPPSPYAGQAAEAAAQDVLNLRALEAIAIRQALQKTGGHKTKAAELLGINERTLRNKLKTDSLRT